jgi:hypothetical protein
MHRLDAAGLRPGRRVQVAGAPDGVDVWVEGGERTTLERVIADHVFVLVA